MKLSKETIEVLKNFSSINQSIVIYKGNKLKTVNSLKNILAHYTTGESFPKDFAIYDLNEFLGLISIMAEPELTFNDTDVTVSSGSQKVKYYYADIDYIVKPEKDIKTPEYNIKFKLKEEVGSIIQPHASPPSPIWINPKIWLNIQMENFSHSVVFLITA